MRATRTFLILASLVVSIQGFSIAVFAGQGALDSTFGINGVKDTTFANPTLITDSVVSGNKVWFAGIAVFDPRNHVIYGRFNLDGTLDFSTVVRPCNADSNNLQDSTSSVNKMSLQPDGKLLITGKCQTFNAGNYQNPYAIRINSNGTLDGSFGVGGIALLDLRTVPACGTLQTTYDIAVAPDGNIIAVGGDGVTPVSTGGCPGAVPASILLKISPTGTLVTSGFFPSLPFRFQGLTIQPDGKILVGYNDPQAIAGVYQILRFNSNFTLDTSFGTNGTATFPIGTGAPRGNVTSIYLESSGKIVVIGYVAPNSAQPSIARFLPNGTLDTTFNGTGSLRFPDDQNVNMTPNKIFRQPDGRYLISGPISNGWGGYRVNPNGTMDSIYGNRIAPGIAWFSPPIGIPTSAPAILPDGSMIQIGYASSVINPIIRLVKINQNQNRNANAADFDGDAKTDLSIFRPNGAASEWWWLKSSTGGNAALQFGTSTDVLAPVDFTGDGKTDVAFWRPSTGFWFVLRSEDFSFYAFPFGATGDVPVPADYDGDGKADAAVFRESAVTWYINKSSGGTDIIGFGAAGDKPVNADYDGDGKSDIAIYRPNGPGGAEWWVRRSSNASVFALQFGSSTDKAVPGDFTGDGKADVAFWRPATGFWNILRSEDFSYYAFPFGANGDVASPGDYDGDGKLDAAVFRPSNSTWYANRSTAGTLIQQFGAAGDVPVPSAFVR